MKTKVTEALNKLIEAVGNYDPSENDDINCVVTDGLMMHLECVAKSIINETGEDWVAEASHYLCDNELSVKDQVERIAAHDNSSDYIDNVEGVVVWEPVTFRFECDEFLSMIGYN